MINFQFRRFIYYFKIYVNSSFILNKRFFPQIKIENPETPLEIEHKNDALIIGPVPPPPSSLSHDAKYDSEAIRNDSNKSSIEQ